MFVECVSRRPHSFLRRKETDLTYELNGMGPEEGKQCPLLALLLLCAQSYRTLCNPMGYLLPGSSVHGILQARTAEWAAISSPRGPSCPGGVARVSCTSCSGRRALTTSATWEAHVPCIIQQEILVCDSYEKLLM